MLWSAGEVDKRLDDLHRRVQSGDPALRSVFTELFERPASGTASCAFEEATHSGPADQTLRGALVCVKDLFDVAGHVTRAGTRFMAMDDPATRDATAVHRLRQAGGILTGHTNMTELAYSGLGLNPHYGTPDNALLPGHVPGGSTSGGAVAVALGVADIAIGTDTGGSLRIPAAFNGIVGFKPSQDAVSRTGCKALSCTLDSVGPMAATVSACSLAFKAMRDEPAKLGRSVRPVLIVPANYGMDDLEPPVAASFDKALSRLRAAGLVIEERSLPVLEHLKSLPAWHFAAVEARAEYDDAYRLQHALIDPRVSSRMARADSLSAVEYRQSLNLRERLIREYREEMQDAVLVMPTVPILPPRLSALDDDEHYNRVNLQVLRNPSIANVLNGCSISLPVRHGSVTTGLMLTAATHADTALLELAVQCEDLLTF